MSSTATTSRTALSRITLVGERHRIDLVLPAREPVGVLLPEIMGLLEDRPAGRPEVRHLVTADGSALAHDHTLESAGIPDGTVLRLVRAEDAPSAPVVHDVSDEVADDLGVRAWRWRPEARRVVAGCAVVLWAVASALLARGYVGPAALGGGILAVAVLAALAGLFCGRFHRPQLAATLVATAGALGVLGVSALADAHAWAGGTRLAALTGVVAVVLALAGRVTPLGRAALTGAGALAAVVAVWEVALGTQDGAGTAAQQARVGALLVVVSLVVLGLLPRLALMASGLTRLDDRRTGGATVARHEVGTALAATHRGLALATLVLGVSGAAGGVLALRTTSPWTVGLAVAATVVLALRARAFPLTVEVVALLLASACVALRLITVWLAHAGSPAGPLAVLALSAVVPLAVLAGEPAEHLRVRLRRLGDTVESLAVIALFPLVVGVFGVYGRLLDTFA
ncbi:type VII secretion integral membrane protein EccD [Streptomyces sp. NPDC014995]|uniref:type VII secretion integral membrane protein EccD n=1 Tax=Streptomyces sp. NPDC014995 TaxID=3364936 RepID=UPI0036FFD772